MFTVDEEFANTRIFLIWGGGEESRQRRRSHKRLRPSYIQFPLHYLSNPIFRFFTSKLILERAHENNHFLLQHANSLTV